MPSPFKPAVMFTFLYLLASYAFAAEPYALDALSRATPSKGKPQCPTRELISYRGTHIDYQKNIRIHPAFKERLEGFEALVVQTGLEVYGRAPHKLKHMGGYKCRRIGGYPNLLSEHSFGNAIDVSRFYFPPLRGEPPTSLPKTLHAEFEVNILQHWTDEKTANGLHQAFLHTLGERLIQSGLFRVLLGPSFPNHKDHFHLDCAPYTLVSIF